MSDTRPPRMTSYEREREQFAIKVPAMFNPVVDILESWAARTPDAAALVLADPATLSLQTITTSALAGRARIAAAALSKLGIEKGDRVMVMLPRTLAWYDAILGAIRLGAVVIPCPAQLTPRDLGYRLQRSGAVCVVTDPSGAEKLAHVAASDLEGVKARVIVSSAGGLADRDDGVAVPASAATTRAEDPMIIFFTSGTVSHPKMVLHPQSYALGHVRTARFWHDLRTGDVHWTVADTGWAKAAWGSLFGQWLEEATVFQVDLPRSDPAKVAEIVTRCGVSSFCAPPTLYRLLVQLDLLRFDWRQLQHCTSAGEPLNPEVIRIWREATGLTIYDGYGQSETTVLVANYRGVTVKPGSMGKPLPGYDVAVVDDEGTPVPANAIGSVAVRAEPRPIGLFSEYLDDAAANAEAFRNGWYFTGDKARMDSEGYFWFEGRADDVITSAAYRIGPFEVESALLEHPAVAESAVVGRPDHLRTEIVCAFIVLASGYEPSSQLTHELQEHARQVTAPYKYPREIYFVDELPKTISGKIRRSELRRRLSVPDSPQGDE